MQTKELIAKLRNQNHITQGDGLSELLDTCSQAADALEATMWRDDEGLQTEIDALIVAALARVAGKADLESLEDFIRVNWPNQYKAFVETLTPPEAE